MTIDDIDPFPLDEQDEAFLRDFDQDIEDRAALEELANDLEVWEIDPEEDV